MKSLNYFNVGENNISYVGDSFKLWFDMDFKKSNEAIVSKTLTKQMTDQEILDELKPEPVTLGDLANALNRADMLKNGYANIFYIKDSAGVLRTVPVRWNGGGWGLYALSVEYPGRWDVGLRVFSRKFLDTPPSDPSPLSHSVLCPHCKKEIKLKCA